MEGTMKAVIYKEAGQPLVIEDVPIPQPTGRELLVRVKAASLCHTDIDIISGGFGPRFNPGVLGHEAVSVVEQLGPDAGSFGFKAGDIIGAPLYHGMCLQCHDCRNVGSDFCRSVKAKGMTAPGYFSEYALVDAASAVAIPASANANGEVWKLAPLFCAGVTVWDALERTQFQIGETVAIIGLGGLGHLAAQYARQLGAKVVGLDVRDEQLEAAKKDGVVDEIINTSSISDAELVQRVSAANNGRSIDHILVTSGAIPAYNTAFKIVKAQGQIIVVGLPTEPISFNAFQVATRHIKLIGAKVAGPQASQRCIDFSLRKGILPKVNSRKFKLEDINEMVELMKAGKVDEGRMVVEFF